MEYLVPAELTLVVGILTYYDFHFLQHVLPLRLRGQKRTAPDAEALKHDWG